MIDGSARPAHPRPVAIVTHSYYEEDPRVRRQAESLAAAGHAVVVFALRRPGDGREGVLEGVEIRRLDVQRHQGAGLGTYLAEYTAFFVRAGAALLHAHRARHFGLVQVATLPDWLVFAALPLRLTGVPLLLDLHEAMPEFFRSRFPRASGPLAHRMLELQERASIRAASHVITVNEVLRERLLAMGIAPGKVSVVLNSPALARFDPAHYPTRPFMADGTLRLVYAGALTPTYELDVALGGLAEFHDARPDVPLALDVYGRGDSAASLAELAGRVGLSEVVTFHGRIRVEAVPAAIASADVGLAPTRRDRFTDLSLSTKIFEYAALRKPTLCSALPLVERTFGASVWTYQGGDRASFAARLGEIVDDEPEREARVAAAAERTRELAWEREAERYLALVDRLALVDPPATRR